MPTTFGYPSGFQWRPNVVSAEQTWVDRGTLDPADAENTLVFPGPDQVQRIKKPHRVSHGYPACFPSSIMRVRLTRKLADVIDGIDLRDHEVDEVFDVSPKDARLLMAEEWAIAERRSADLPHANERRAHSHGVGLDKAADRG